MTEAEWLVSNHPLPMVVHVLDNVSHNKLARLVVALYRINGKVNECNEVESLIDTSTQKSLMWGDCRNLAVGCAFACTDGRDNGKMGADAVRDIIGNPFRKVTLPNDPRCRACGGVGRFTVGNGEDAEPMRCPCCPWFTPDVLSLAQVAHNELWDKAEEVARIEKMIDTQRFIMSRCYSDSAYRVYSSNLDRFRKELAKVEELPYGMLDPQRLKILSDALEEAGCEGDKCDACRDGYQTAGQSVYPCRRCMGSRTLDHPILSHFCSPGPHYRGCWAIDLILGKE